MVNNMDSQQMQNQVDMFRQMSQQQGVSGIAYIDVYPASGSLRYKLKVTPPERRAEIIANISLVLEMMSQAFNLQTKKIINKEADNG